MSNRKSFWSPQTGNTKFVLLWGVPSSRANTRIGGIASDLEARLCVCVFESLPQQLPAEEGGRERVHCTLSQ